MSVQENIELLERAWAAYDKGDEEGFAACLTPDWREYGPSGSGDGATLEDERPTMRLHREAFPDKHTEIHRIVASETMVACHPHRHGDPHRSLPRPRADRQEGRGSRDDVQPGSRREAGRNVGDDIRQRVL